MNTLLINDFISYLKSKNSAVVSVKIQDLRFEVITDTQFDIKDKEPTIKQCPGKGSVTYNNHRNKVISVIDYEKFLNFQPNNVIKNLKLKKPDFIVYDCDNSYFIINELSHGDPKNKRTRAFQQMHSAVFHFDKIPGIKLFVNKFINKICVFSNREMPILTPEGIADAFFNFDNYLPEPVKHDFKPITKLGYILVETSKMDI